MRRACVTAVSQLLPERRWSSVSSMTDQAMRVPQQDRSRRTLERIVDTSIQILGEEGWDAVTVGEVERRSGVSRGAFYTRFPTREALLDHVENTVMQRVVLDQSEALDEAEGSGHSTLEEAVYAGVGAIATIFRKHGPVLMHTDRTGGGTESGIRAISDLGERFGALVHGYLEPSGESLRAVQFAIRLVFDSLVLRTRRPSPFATHEPSTFDEHVDRLARVVAAYLATYSARP